MHRSLYAWAERLAPLLDPDEAKLLKEDLREAEHEGAHLSHCNFGEHADSCKYGEHDTCPALSEAWSWLGKNLQRLERLEAVASLTQADLLGTLQEKIDDIQVLLKGLKVKGDT
jgi:hypothetical protein